jgi:hypothetical protein
VFKLFEELWSLSGSFYVVWDSKVVRDFPSYGSDVVAILLQDEYCTLPRYLGRVKFMFKASGFLPQFAGSLHLA